MYYRSPQKPVSNLLQRGTLAKHFESLKLAKRIAAIIAPVCEQATLGVTITPDCLRISVKQVRVKDKNPYEVSLDEDPREQFLDTLVLEVGLPNTACVTRFKQFLPSVKNVLAQRGFGALEVRPKLDENGHHPVPFLSTERGKPIGGKGAYEGAKDLSERLPEDSPLKASMEKLAESLRRAKC